MFVLIWNLTLSVPSLKWVTSQSISLVKNNYVTIRQEKFDRIQTCLVILTGKWTRKRTLGFERILGLICSISLHLSTSVMISFVLLGY